MDFNFKLTYLLNGKKTTAEKSNADVEIIKENTENDFCKIVYKENDQIKKLDFKIN